MSKGILGEMISKYRKEARLTQEELGKAVGVSTQAVSRWECGGTPDVELLPAIADCLHVSIDALYGRDSSEALDLETLIQLRLRHLPPKQCADEILKTIWLMQKTMLLNETPELENAFDMIPIQVADRSTEENPWIIPARILLCNERYNLLFGVVKDRPFAAILEEPENGFASTLKNTEEYVRLFTLLAKPHYLEMLIDIDMRKPKEYFTAKSAAVRLGIPPEEALAILEELYSHVLLERMEIADEQGTVSVYSKSSDVNLLAFLFFCEEIMHSSEAMYINVDIRKTPLLKAAPGTQNPTPSWQLRDMPEKEAINNTRLEERNETANHRPCKEL